MNSLASIFYHTIRSGAVNGFAAYGAAVVYNANPVLAAQIGAIYGITASLIYPAAKCFTKDFIKGSTYIANATLAFESIVVVACRSFNLIGNQGFLILGALTLARFAISKIEINGLIAQKAKHERRSTGT